MQHAAIHLLGIRHHGPGSARATLAALDELAPDAIALEAPAEAESVFGLVADEDLVPPVALLGYAVEHPERAAFYPLARFSPEWVALRWAAANGVPVRAMDLPLAHLSAGRPPPIDALGELANAAGYTDPERWWEDVIEHRGAQGSLARFAAVADAMAAVRAHAGPAEGREAAREAHMRTTLREMGKAGHRKVAVVCGAWHVPALSDEMLARTAAADRATLTGLPKEKVAITWVPWANRRLATASGYGAGVSSPGWYDHVFSHPPDQVVITWFRRAAELLRRADHPVSPDHVIASVALSRRLAELRDRPVAGLPEVLDAAAAVFAAGSSTPLRLIDDALIVGDALGSVPASTPMVPLARDVQHAQRRLRLKPDAGARTLELDLRTELGRGRSQLLHRLTILAVPWGRLSEGRGTAGTFRETWRLRWEPEFEVALVVASAAGTTLPGAASARLAERAATETTLAGLTRLLDAALAADLPEAVEPLVAQLAERAALASDVAGLLDAVAPLATSLRYGDVRATDRSALAQVVNGVVARIVAGLRPACLSLGDDEALAMAERISAAHAAFALLDHEARRERWPRALDGLVGATGVHGVIAGRAARLCADTGWWQPERSSRELAAALSVGSPAARGAAFLDGFLAGSGTVLLHDEGLLGLLDDWVAGLAVDSFGDVVPLLRRLFGGFEVAERRLLGLRVSGRGDGRPPAPYGWDLDPERAAAALRTVADLLGVDP